MLGLCFHSTAGRSAQLVLQYHATKFLFSGQRVDTVRFEHFEGVRRGFSLGGRLAISQYDPLRSLSLTVHRGKRDFTSYNLTASSALNCQM